MYSSGSNESSQRLLQIGQRQQVFSCSERLAVIDSLNALRERQRVFIRRVSRKRHLIRGRPLEMPFTDSPRLIRGQRSRVAAVSATGESPIFAAMNIYDRRPMNIQWRERRKRMTFYGQRGRNRVMSR